MDAIASRYNFKIIHKPGKNHFGADVLSRATPAEEVESLQTELPDAALFRMEVDMEEYRLLSTCAQENCQASERRKGREPSSSRPEITLGQQMHCTN